jgi:hypothetical protein
MPDHQAEYVDLPIYHDQLAGALGFSPSDLQANQSGRLTDSQRTMQFGQISRAIVMSAVFLALAIGCLVLAFAIGVTTGLGLLLVLLAGCFTAFLALIVWVNIPFARDLRAGVVSSIEGLVQPAERETRIRTGPGTGVPIWSYSWVVDGAQRFAVSGRTFAVLTPARHRLYFLPLSRRIVAAKPISTMTN